MLLEAFITEAKQTPEELTVFGEENELSDSFMLG